MPVVRKSVTKEPIPPSRFQNSPLYATTEWKDTLREINKGLKPKEYIEVILSKKTIGEIPMKDPIQAFVVALRRYIRSRKMPIDVTTRAREDGDGLRIFAEGRDTRVA